MHRHLLIFLLGSALLAGCSSRRSIGGDGGSRADVGGLIIDGGGGPVPDLGAPADTAPPPLPDFRRPPRPDVGISGDAAGIACRNDSPCKGYACDRASGRCREGCLRSSECASTHLCDAFRGVCVKRTTCKGDSDCGPYTCVSGVCRVLCTTASHCSKGAICQAGRCVKPATCKDDTPCKGFTCNKTRGTCNAACGGPIGCATGYACTFLGTCEKQITCKDDTPCKGFRCVTSANLCRVTCSIPSTTYCASGHFCNHELRCVKPRSCRSHAECGAYLCSTRSRQCFVACWSSRGYCKPGFRCVRRRCVR